MTRLSPETMARHISDGVRTIDFIVNASGWGDQEVRRYALDMGYALDSGSRKFRPVPPATLKDRPAGGPLLAKASDRTAPRDPSVAAVPQGRPAATEVRPAYRDLIEEGKASSVVKVQRAAVKAKVALEQLSHLLDATRQAERMRAAAEAEKAAVRAELEQIKAREAELRAKLRGTPRPAAEPASSEPDASSRTTSKRPPIGVDYRALDAWCQETGRPWRKQGMGRPSNALIAEYHASLQDGAA